MSNNIKKGLVILSLAFAYVSGSAAGPTENTQNHKTEAGQVPMQQNHDIYNPKAQPFPSEKWQKFTHRKDRPGDH